MIAWIGAGLLGANFVRALRARGEDVRVWNRTHAKAVALEQYGAQAFADPAEAARGADRVHLVLTDDAAVDDALARLAPGLSADAVIIDHTTTSLDGAAARTKAWAGRYQHAPVFMAPQNALDSTGVMMISGDAALRDRVTPLLTPMTGKLVYLGPDPTHAALYKLMGNLLILAIGGGLADMLALGKANGVKPEAAIQLFEFFKLGATLEPRAQRMATGDLTQPSWALAMARKDAGLMQAAAGADARLAVLPGVIEAMEAWIAKGHGGDDWLIIGKDALA